MSARADSNVAAACDRRILAGEAGFRAQREIYLEKK
jgi:hypothetical protein